MHVNYLLQKRRHMIVCLSVYAMGVLVLQANNEHERCEFTINIYIKKYTSSPKSIWWILSEQHSSSRSKYLFLCAWKPTRFPDLIHCCSNIRYGQYRIYTISSVLRYINKRLRYRQEWFMMLLVFCWKCTLSKITKVPLTVFIKTKVRVVCF